MDDAITTEITNSIKALYDLTARVDERVKIIGEKQVNFEHRLETLIENQQGVTTRVSILESKNGQEVKGDISANSRKISDIEKDMVKMTARVDTIASNQKTANNIWLTILDYVTRGGWIIFICWLLYRFGLQTPPLP